MANKNRPKKNRGAFYKKYVYGESAEKYVEQLKVQSTASEWYDNSSDHAYSDLEKSTNINITGKAETQGKLKLPLELILTILKLTPNPYCTNHLLVCRTVYWSFLKDIYENPKLKANNLLDFLDIISGDNAALVRKPEESVSNGKNVKLQLKRKFQNTVKCLDLSNVIQSGKNSNMSKLLRRTSPSLEIFVSSQSSFGPAPLISLRGCSKLKILDLRLVNETVNLVELFKSCECLTLLEQLSFPRSSVVCDEYDFNWPPNLWYLRLQGGVSDTFAMNVRFPHTITCLEFAYCPNLTSSGLDYILGNIGINLKRLSITYPMPKIGDQGADHVFYYCPNIRSFCVDVAYISWELFGDEYLVTLEEYDRPLKNIVIESVGYMGMCDKLTPNDITVAVDEERLPCLKTLGLSSLLGWDFRGEDMEDMVSELHHHGIEVFKI